MVPRSDIAGKWALLDARDRCRAVRIALTGDVSLGRANTADLCAFCKALSGVAVLWYGVRSPCAGRRHVDFSLRFALLRTESCLK